MKRFIVLTLLVASVGLFGHAQSQYRNPDIAWGLSAGGAHGSNISGDAWVMQYRAYLQADLFSPVLMGQFGLGYADIMAPGVYSTQTGMMDLRLLLTPFTLSNLNPYLYGGIAVSKRLTASNSDYLPMIPFGAGIQTAISRGILLNIDGGYNLSLSDDFDGRDRTTGVNVITNEKQDGFYGFTIGLAFTIGSDYIALE
ncbi:MAG: hypothetical protein ACYC09_06570 [Bacteroidota bacterium]